MRRKSVFICAARGYNDSARSAGGRAKTADSTRSRVADEKVHAHAEHGGKRDELSDVRFGTPLFPVAHGRHRQIELFAQLFLRKITLQPQGFQNVGKIHITIIPLLRGRINALFDEGENFL